MAQWRENRRIGAVMHDRGSLLPGNGGRQILPTPGVTGGGAAWR